MPKFKVRAEGDNIRMADQVVLESIKVPGQFLHTSGGLFGDKHPDADCHEISLSFRTTTFVLYPHRLLADDIPNTLKAGHVIQLYHKVCPSLGHAIVVDSSWSCHRR